jgi:acyl-coenzyme A synthetase/AMP-(fatty) acid ligase
MHNSVGGDELRKHCMEVLSAFRVPREVKIVERLPQTPNGKILHAALRRIESESPTS